MSNDIIEHYLYNLKTIASIPKNGRINTNGEYFTLEEPSSFQGIKRKWEGSTRERAIQCVMKDILTVIKITSLLVESKNIYIIEAQMSDLEKIVKGLIYAIKGLENLGLTYDDPNVSSKIDPLIVVIKTHLRYVYDNVKGLPVIPF